MSAARSKKIRLPSGNIIDVYPIGVLAKALNRSSLTIRRWEKKGIIPDTFFTDSRGFRMYSMEQINIIVDCEKKAGINKKGTSIVDTCFSKMCHERLNELRLKYARKEI